MRKIMLILEKNMLCIISTDLYEKRLNIKKSIKRFLQSNHIPADGKEKIQ